MEISLETKEWLALMFAFGFGFGCLGFFILLPVLYCRLTRKYDAMFPEYDRIVPLPTIMGAVTRTGLYACFIVFKNLRKHKRHKITQEVTNHYDFRGNAVQIDIVLSYLCVFTGFLTIGSLIAFLFFTKVLGVEL
ncbi:MAG: hypothetical protein L3J89_10625 [Gammaproteobacteria bacterium]|nr:hypothetical protein [Gammaproteobacteria bacterium]